jgi:bacterioferritin-associated ferredoxin
MILCVCQTITDREVDAAIRDGARSIADVTRACGAAKDCGCCRPVIAERIDRACDGDCSDCPGLGPALASAAL